VFWKERKKHILTWKFQRIYFLSNCASKLTLPSFPLNHCLKPIISTIIITDIVTITTCTISIVVVVVVVHRRNLNISGFLYEMVIIRLLNFIN
jgi:hypothetical protein